MTKTATPFLRFLAFSVDMGISTLLFLLPLIALFRANSVAAILDQLLMIVVLFIFVYPMGITVLHCFMIAKFGATVGKLVTSLEIETTEGKRLSFWRAFFRTYIGYMVSSLFFGLGFWWILKDKNHLAWHDQIAHTKVVTKHESGLLTGLAGLVILCIVNIFLVQTIVTEFNLRKPLYMETLETIKEEQTSESLIQEDLEVKREAY